MYKFKTRLLSLLLSILMIIAVIPAPVATAANVNFGGPSDFVAGATLDYDALFKKAMIINPWRAMKEETTLTFTFRGTSHSELYNPNRHFKNFDDAYAKWLELHPGAEAAKETGIFIFAGVGAYTNTFTVNYSAIILGANAGTDPNNRAFTEETVTTTTIKNGWAAATRKTESKLGNVVITRTAEQDDYVLQAGGKVSVIVDGFDIQSNTQSVHVANVKAGKSCAITSEVHIQNSIIRNGEDHNLIFNSSNATYNNYFGLKNVRMDTVNYKGLYNSAADKVSVDGVYYANTTRSFIGESDSSGNNAQYVTADEFDLHITNSYFYKNSAAEVMNIRVETQTAHRDVSINIDNTMFYECGSSMWNMMEFNVSGTTFNKTSEQSGDYLFNDNYYEFNFTRNTVVADASFNAAEPNLTVFEGNASKQKGSFTIHVNENRFVGYRSIFPNTGSYSSGTQADFNNNYYELNTKIYPNDTTGKGIKSNYCNVDNNDTILDDNGNEITNPGKGYDPYQEYMYCYNYIKGKQSKWDSHQINLYMGNKSSYGYNEMEYHGSTFASIYNSMYRDPYNYLKLTYYTDWNRTHLNNNGQTVFETIGNNFFEKVNYFNIDYANKKIYIGIENGTTISNPQMYFLSSRVSSGFYTNSDCTTSTSSLTASNNSTKTYYMKAWTSSSSYIIYTVTVYATSSDKSYSAFTSYNRGYASGSALLYDPACASKSNGASHTALWDGEYYTFTVGTNAFGTLDALFAKAGDNPTIILTAGTYNAFTVTEPCTIYGYNGRYYASAGDQSIYDWSYGPGWGTSHETIVKGITVGNMNNKANFNLNIYGIRLTGQFTDTTRTVAGRIELRNSIIDNTTNNTRTDEYYQFNVGNSSVKSAANTYYMCGVKIENIGENKSGQGIFMGGSLPTSFNMDYCHFTAPQLTKLYGTTWPIANVDRAVHVWHCRIENISGDTTLLSDVDLESTNGNKSEIQFRYTTVIADNYNGTLIDVSPFNYKDGNKVTIDYSIFVNRSGNAKLLNLDYANSNATMDSYCVFSGNRIVGFMGGISAENAGAIYSGRYINLKDSYFAPYTPDFDTAENGICPTGDVVCDSYYTDFAMTKKVDPMAGYSFKSDKNLAVNNNDLTLTLTVDKDTTSVDLEDYVVNEKGFVLSTTFADSGKTANIQAIPVDDNVTTVILKVANYQNPHIYREWKVYVKRAVSASLGISEITTDVGAVVYNKYTGVYTLTLPEDKSGASVTVKTADKNATAKVSGTISDIKKGEIKDYTVTVTCNGESKDYILRVYREAGVGMEIGNYDYYAEHAAYIIDPDWANPTDTVSFVFRGKTYTQPYDASRHFASFAAAYAHHEANRDHIIHNIPIFIFTAGTYTEPITVRYNAILLGTNAGITPNDPAMNAKEMTPATKSVAKNSAWDSANETVFNCRIQRTTRVNGSNSDLTYENAMVSEENASGRKMSYNIVLDGFVTSVNDNFVSAQDIDVPNAKGYRDNNIYLQNFIAKNASGNLVWAQDTSYNHTTAHINNMRMEGGSIKIAQKYVDNIVVNNSYFTGVTYSAGLLAGSDSMAPRHDINYQFTNNVFASNSFTKFIDYNASYATGDYKKGYIGIKDNYFYDNAAVTTWGLFRFIPAFENMTYEIDGNLIYEPDYAIDTLTEGNGKYFAYPYDFKFTNNRVIGNIASIFPNLNDVSASTLSALHWDFTDNYVATSFSSVDDVAGVAPVYKTAPNLGTDPILTDDFTYYLDYKMTVKNNGLDIVLVNAGSAEVSDVTFANGVATATLTGDDISGLSVSANNPDAEIKFYTDSNCTTAATLTGLNASKTFYIRAEYKGFKGTAVKLTLTKSNSSGGSGSGSGSGSASTGMFTDSFVDPAGLIKNTAIMVDTTLTGSTGSIVESKWNGVTYKFVYGENAFNSLGSMYTYVKSKKPASIQVLVANHTKGDSFSIQYAGEYFTPNYATSPFIKTNGEKAIDWDGSSNWKENPEFMERSELVCAKNLTVSGADAKGNITLYGFTYTGTHYEQRTSTGTFNFSLVNTLKIGTDGDSSFLFHYKSDANLAGSDAGDSDVAKNNPSNNDSVTLKNYYLKEVKQGQRLFTETVPAHITFDGLWVEGHESKLNFQRCFPKTMSDNSSFTIKNSFLRNLYSEVINANGDLDQIGIFNLEPYKKDDVEEIGERTFKVTYDNNIMYNFANYFGAANLNTDITEGKRSFFLLRFYSKSISDVIITNNYVANPLAGSTSIFHSEYFSTNEREDGSVKIIGNTFNGVTSNHNINSGSNYAHDKMEIHHNYTVTTYTEDLANAGLEGVRATATVGMVGENGYWKDYARTKYSIDGFRIGGAKVDEVDHVYIYNTNRASKIDLNTYIEDNGDYTMKIYADEERLIERDVNNIYVPASGTTVYVELRSKLNQYASPRFVTVHIVNSSEYYINNVYAGAVKDGDMYNVMSWRGTLTATGAYAYDKSTTFGGADSGESFGVIYMASDDNLEAIKAALTEGKDNIEATVASINANSTYASSAKVYLVTDQKTAWNEATQSISYLYKFKVKEGNKRATVMYTVYVDDNGEKQILFSNIDVQTSTSTVYPK